MKDSQMKFDMCCSVNMHFDNVSIHFRCRFIDSIHLLSRLKWILSGKSTARSQIITFGCAKSCSRVRLATRRHSERDIAVKICPPMFPQTHTVVLAPANWPHVPADTGATGKCHRCHRQFLLSLLSGRLFHDFPEMQWKDFANERMEKKNNKLLQTLLWWPLAGWKSLHRSKESLMCSKYWSYLSDINFGKWNAAVADNDRALMRERVKAFFESLQHVP